MNPMGKDGKINTCGVCRSIYHYVRDCPDKNNDSEEETGRRKVYFSLSDNNDNEEVGDRKIYFVGCTSS